MPVGDRFSRICEHFTPVASTEVVCIIANSTHANDLIMAYAVGAGRRETENDFDLHCVLEKINKHLKLEKKKNWNYKNKKSNQIKLYD